jgi:hypothetical protein
MCLVYITTQSVPCSIHSPPWFYKTSLLTLLKAKVAVCCEIVHNTYTQSEHQVEFLNVKPSGMYSNRKALKC